MDILPDLSLIERVLISMGLTSAVHQIGKHLIGEEIRERRKLNETALQPILQKAAEDVSDIINCKDFTEEDSNEICLFLTSPEAEAIVRQIYAAKILENQHSWEQIETAFLENFFLLTEIPEDGLKDAAREIFQILIAGCEGALGEAIDKGKLSAHEAKSQFRHLILRDELATVQNKIDLLISLQKPNREEILKFEKDYRQQVGEREGKIRPPYLYEARQWLIDELYVSPNVTPISRKKDEQLEKLTLTYFYQGIYRTVLLGNPGGGKSTLAKKLCYDLATHYSDRLLAERQLTPILVILREYGSQKKTNPCSFLQFIETKANSTHQISPPTKAFEYLLLNGRVAVIFDGLDELTDTSDRQEISADVESFCNLYPSVPVLVTSREVGYKEAPLDERKFDLFRLTDFEDEQVSEYVNKWFAVDLDLTEDERKQKVEAFLTESKTVPDLRSNPLMLGLMCNIYRGAGYIPENRPDVYEKCAEMMFERWDKSRKISVPQPIQEIKSHVRRMMMYLAHWIYTNEKLQGGVTERKLIETATDYLCPRRFENRDEAELAAREFIQFCRGRAWVFTDVGTTKEGEKLYQFTHRTFLEYFTASYLVRCHRTPEDLLEVLLPRIKKQEWYIVTQLAFQIQNKNLEEAGDELLTLLVRKINETKTDKRTNLLFFTVHCLEFMIPSPQVTRNITATYCEWLINRNILPYYDSDDLDIILSTPLEVATENLEVVKSALENHLKETIINLRDGVFNAIEVIYFLSNEVGYQDKYWQRLFKCLLDEHPEKIPILCQRHILICLYIYLLEKVDFDSLLEWHGIRAIFTDFGFDSCSVSRLPLGEFFVRCILAYYYYLEDSDTLKNLHLPIKLRKVGQLAINSPQHPYLVEGKSLSLLLHSLSTIEVENVQPQMLDIDSEFLFGSFIVFATIIEDDYKHNVLEEFGEIERIINSKIAFFDYICWTLIARFDPTTTDKVQPELDRCGFTPEQKIFIWQWVRGEIDFVEIESSEETVDENTLAKVL